ncbi:MAG: hypothetical protein AB7T49_16895 [Oligoflexales bacterium]
MKTLLYAGLSLLVCACRSTTASDIAAQPIQTTPTASSSIPVASCSDGSDALTLYLAKLEDAGQMKDFSYGVNQTFPVEQGENALRMDICEAGKEFLDIEQIVLQLDRRKSPEVYSKQEIKFIQGLTDAVLDDKVASLQVDVKPEGHSDTLQIKGWHTTEKDFVTVAPVVVENQTAQPHLTPDFLDSILVGVLDYGNPFQLGDALVSELVLGTAHIRFWTKSQNLEGDQNQTEILKVEIADTSKSLEPGDRQVFSYTDPATIKKLVRFTKTQNHLNDKLDIVLPHAKYRAFIFKDDKNTSYQTQYGRAPWSKIAQTHCEEWVNYDRKCD